MWSSHTVVGVRLQPRVREIEGTHVVRLTEGEGPAFGMHVDELVQLYDAIGAHLRSVGAIQPAEVAAESIEPAGHGALDPAR